ncbi:MAG: 6-phosphogluconolactonase [Verrucomicrobia bacterium]|nr:6-phosphogluconolactonase [Verrucomicrobiota bacterium]
MNDKGDMRSAAPPASRYAMLTFGSSAELAETAARRWLDELAARKATAGYCAAVSGGRIAKTFFNEIARQAQARPRLLAPVHFFWADERCVPPADSESNYGLAHTHLLAPLGIAAARVHRVRGETAPGVAADEAEAELRRVASLNSVGVPVLDMIFLGMGEDGHVASLFPGPPTQVPSPGRIYYPVTASKPPPERITLGLATILAARAVWVMVSGPGKERALRESLRPDGRTPLAQVLRGRTNTIVFTEIRLERGPSGVG